MPDLHPPDDDLLRLLVDRVKDYAIFVLDPHGMVSSWNAGAERIKGYKAHEIIGHHFSRFYPPEAVRSGWPQHELSEAKKLGRFEDEGWRVRKDGSKFWANVVITALHDDQGRLRGFAKVTRDLTERKRVERLEADARTMGEFVAMLGHELRNPLAPINSALEVAMHPGRTPERLDMALQIMSRQTRHLARLVDDLLDVSRISSGQIHLERRRIRLSVVVDAAIESTRVICERRGHTVRVEKVDDPVVRGDVVRLTQIVTNLLTNACKYTPEGGAVTLRLTREGDEAVLEVCDTGVGIPEDLLPRLFDLFTQDKRMLDRADGGLGLGLAISRKLASLHRGDLEAASAGRGCGSTFRLRLPALADDGDRLVVLIVDDNEDAALTLQTMMQMLGHVAHVAMDGEAGIRAAERLAPDVVLLDIGLPGMDGYEVARRLRAIPDLDGVQLAAVTGYGSPEDREAALAAGFDHHFAKPVRLDTLVERLPVLAGRG